MIQIGRQTIYLAFLEAIDSSTKLDLIYEFNGLIRCSKKLEFNVMMSTLSLTRLLFGFESKAETDIYKFDKTSNPYSEIQVLTKHEDVVRILVRLGNYRFASAAGTVIIIWNFETGELEHDLTGHHRHPVTCMVGMNREDGQFRNNFLLLSASFDNLICVWNIDTGNCLQTLTDHNCVVKCMVKMEHNNLLAGAGQHISIWDGDFKLLCSYERLENHAEINHIICINYQLLVCAIDRRLEVYLLTANESIEGIRNLRMYRNLGLTHRDTIRALITLGDNGQMFASGSIDGMIVLWHSNTLNILHKLNIHKSYQGVDKTYPYSVQHLVFSKNLLLAAIGNGFSIYDVISGKTCFSIQHENESKILHIEMIDRYQCVTCSEDGRVRNWGIIRKDCKRDSDNLLTPELYTYLVPIDDVCQEILKGSSLNKQRLCVSLNAECIGHSGAVQMMINFNSQGFVTCGADQLVILWKNGDVEATKRWNILRTLINSESANSSTASTSSESIAKDNIFR